MPGDASDIFRCSNKVSSARVLLPDEAWHKRIAGRYFQHAALAYKSESVFVLPGRSCFYYAKPLHKVKQISFWTISGATPNKALETMTVGHRRCNWMS